MKLITQKISLFSSLPWLVFVVCANVFTARPTQAQSCAVLQGNIDVMPGDLAHLHSASAKPSVKLLPGMRSKSKAVYSGAPGEVVLIRSASIAYDTCYRWLYVEVDDSGKEGWLRSDNVRSNSQLNIRPSCEELKFVSGDVAQLYNYRETPNQVVNLRNGAGYNVRAAYSAPSGTVVDILSASVRAGTCYQWLYVEVQDSGVRGYVRADNVRAN